MLPFLLGDTIVGRADLKADRARSTLVVQAAHAEEGVVPDGVVEPLTAELRLMASWLGLEQVEIKGRGDLAAALRR